MPHLLTHSLEADDAVSLTYYELGSGRPPVLLHGYMTPAIPTWVDANIAERLAGDGHRVIMPDLRGHGASVPTNGHAYPPDALTTDLLTLIAQLDLGEYDLGGYSLGARIVARSLTLSAQPQRAVIGGTGLHPIVHAARWVPQQRAAELSRPAEHRTSTPGPRLGRADLTPPRRRTRGQASLALALAMRSDRPPPDPPLRLDVFVDADAGSPPTRDIRIAGG